jgi:uncharacterized membrane protein
MKTKEELYEYIIKDQQKQIHKLERQVKEDKKIIHNMNVILYVSLAVFCVIAFITNFIF